MLPQFAVDILLARWARRDSPNPHIAVFVKRTGNWLSPNNVCRDWRKVREKIGFGWVTPRTCPKSCKRSTTEARGNSGDGTNGGVRPGMAKAALPQCS